MRWFYSPNSNASQPLEVHKDPKLTTSSYNLVFHNVTGAYEGIYSCQAQFNDGSTSPIVPAACLYIAGECVAMLYLRLTVIECKWRVGITMSTKSQKLVRWTQPFVTLAKLNTHDLIRPLKRLTVILQ